MNQLLFWQVLQSLENTACNLFDRQAVKSQHNHTWNMLRQVTNIRKITIKGYQNAFFLPRQFQYLFIGSTRGAKLADSYNIKAFRSDCVHNLAVDILVRQESYRHRKGFLASYGRRLHFLILQELVRIPHCISNLLFVKLRVGALNNLIKGVCLRYQIQNVFYQNARASNTRFAVSSVRIERDVRVCHNEVSMPYPGGNDKKAARFHLVGGIGVILVSIFLFLFSPAAAHAADRYWVGSAGGNTSDGANWASSDPASCTGGGAGAPGARTMHSCYT